MLGFFQCHVYIHSLLSIFVKAKWAEDCEKSLYDVSAILTAKSMMIAEHSITTMLNEKQLKETKMCFLHPNKILFVSLAAL